ncbi:MAG: LapA family protein, partial [Fischerella sp.]|nr:LapA family protein [Fischerella sp.]
TYTNPPRSQTKTSSQSSAVDDWETDSLNDDWDFEEKSYRESTSSPQDTQVRDSSTYERQQEPKTAFQSGSSYSYSYREPKNSGVGKTESIYDADYRVIIPPYKPPTDNQTEEDNQTDEDDWGFLEDFEDEDKEKRSRK